MNKTIDRHAYLIIAHNEPELLYKLLSLLDYEDNDIYLHLDKRAACFSEDCLRKVCRKSRLFFAERAAITWGGYSLIDVELRLLEMAFRNDYYTYFHCISGVDLPLKKQEDIHMFFNENKGKEFIHFCDDDFNRIHKTRYARYHFLQDWIGRPTHSLAYFIERLSLKVQSILGIDRSEKGICYKGGSEWFSITHSLANYVINNKNLIKKWFKFGLCCDEFFLQTLVYNSRYYKNVYKLEEAPSYISCMRYVDWKRGDPYVFRAQDVDELLCSGYLFARKFSTSEIEQRNCVDIIVDRIKSTKE